MLNGVYIWSRSLVKCRNRLSPLQGPKLGKYFFVIFQPRWRRRLGWKFCLEKLKFTSKSLLSSAPRVLRGHGADRFCLHKRGREWEREAGRYFLLKYSYTCTDRPSDACEATLSRRLNSAMQITSLHKKIVI